MANESEPAAGPHARSDAEKRFEKFAEMAVDVDTALAFIGDAASVASGLWVTYLGILAYLGITVGAVTHADLFLERPIKLPLLQDAPVPLVAFFVLAPIIFVIWHAYTLLHFYILAAKVEVLENELRNLGKGAENVVRQFRWQLPANIFVQFLAGHPSLRKGRIGVVSETIAWTSLVFGPILLLLLVQVQFLPYHSQRVTWLHRGLILVDLGLVWTLWPVVVEGEKAIWSLRGPRLVLLIMSAVALNVSVPLATFPGEILDQNLAWRWIPSNSVTAFLGAVDESNEAIPTSLHDLLFNGPFNPATQGRRSPLSNTLVLPNFRLLEAKQLDEGKLNTIEYTLTRRGAHFENAIFRGADLRKVDLENALLQGADLTQADLRSAQLRQANLEGARLYQTKLQLASLFCAQAVRANLEGARLEGAYVGFAKLNNASLTRAELQASAFGGADLEEASLKDARLDAADFGTMSDPLNLRNADVSGVTIWGTKVVASYLATAHGSEQIGKPGPQEGLLERKSDAEDYLKTLLTELSTAPANYQTEEARKRLEGLKVDKFGEALVSAPPGDTENRAQRSPCEP